MLEHVRAGEGGGGSVTIEQELHVHTITHFRPHIPIQKHTRTHPHTAYMYIRCFNLKGITVNIFSLLLINEIQIGKENASNRFTNCHTYYFFLSGQKLKTIPFLEKSHTAIPMNLIIIYVCGMINNYVIGLVHLTVLSDQPI